MNRDLLYGSDPFDGDFRAICVCGNDEFCDSSCMEMLEEVELELKKLENPELCQAVDVSSIVLRPCDDIIPF